jgi:hypothetical protein
MTQPHDSTRAKTFNTLRSGKQYYKIEGYQGKHRVAVPIGDDAPPGEGWNPLKIR